MAEYQDKLLIDLEVHIKQLMLLCDSLKDENVRLKAEIQSKQQEIDSLNIELKQLKTKYDNLKLARTITAASVNVDDAGVKLSKLVREVDKCINLLK